MSHMRGEGYSGHNKIPTIQRYEQELSEREAHSEREIPEPERKDAAQTSQEAEKATDSEDTKDGAQAESTAIGDKRGGKAEKERILANSQPQKATDKAKQNLGGSRIVNDPVTGKPVRIQDADFDVEDEEGKNKRKKYDVRQLDGGSGSGPSLHPPPEGSVNDSVNITPHPAQPTNILLQQFPPAISDQSMAGIAHSINVFRLGLWGALALVWFFVSTGSGWFRFFFRSSLIGACAAAVGISSSLLERNLERNIDSVRADMERQRGEKFSPPTPESVEWLNSLFKLVWPLINPDLFVSVGDMIEDVMQASLPTFIDSVRIADLGQGSNSLRLVAMRGLPDSDSDRVKRGKHWIDQGKNEEKQEHDESSTAAASEQSGSHLNLEVSFLYQALPSSQSVKSKAQNIHLLIEFFVGLAGWFNVKIPIWVEVKGIAGTVRLRLQMVPDPPFVRNATFTLMGTPKVDISVVPMTRLLPNLLDLPFISGFVHSAIQAAASEYVAPKSMTMDLAQMLMGDDVKKDTKALGVLVVTIHYATELAPADSNGKSDPYVVVAFAKFGKPLYSTRICTEELNPVFEETCYLLVSDDEIKSNEAISCQLWDSDARSADDILGRVEIPLSEAMKVQGRMAKRADKLEGFEDNSEMPGNLHWSVGYYEKVKLNPKMREEAQKKKEDRSNLPEHIQDNEQLQEQPAKVDTQEEADVLSTPPDPKYPAGIFSIIIHQISGLEVQNVQGATGSMKEREGKPGQDTKEPSIADDEVELPSSYCEVAINDDLVYRTRTKQLTTTPFFNAGTEKFVRDYRKTLVRVIIRDARLREHDAVLGQVALPLGDIFNTQSEVTRLFSMTDGVGFGRVRLSLLFKGVALQLPPALGGWDTGLVQLTAPIKITGQVASTLSSKKLTIMTADSKDAISPKNAKLEGDTATWQLDSLGHDVRLPVFHRYASAVVFSFGGGTLSKPDAMAPFWLKDIPDDTEQEVTVDILKSPDIKTLMHNVINEQTKVAHKYEVIGQLTTKILFDPGLDPDHENISTGDQSREHVFTAYMAAEGAEDARDKLKTEQEKGYKITKSDKELTSAELRRRNRGVMQVKGVRSAKWFKDGVKSKSRSVKQMILPGLSTKQPSVETEI